MYLDAVAFGCPIHQAFSHQSLTMLVSELKLPEDIMSLLSPVFHISSSSIV